MLNTVVASRFIKQMGNGRTIPCLLECEDENGDAIEVVTKCSNGCFEKEKNLILEAIVAMLGADLELPVPEPFVVKIEDEFISLIQDEKLQVHFRNSSRYAFGSKHIRSFSVWPTGQEIPNHLATEAAEIFIFDAITVNSDRRPINPNCLFSGDEVAIFDHELTFQKILFWKAPWVDGGFDEMNHREKHIFAKPYFQRPPANLDRFIEAWESLSDERLQAYKNALPSEWVKDTQFVDDILSTLREVRGNIRSIVENGLRALQ